MADDSAVDKADEAAKFWANLDPDVEELLEFPDDAELFVPALDEL